MSFLDEQVWLSSTAAAPPPASPREPETSTTSSYSWPTTEEVPIIRSRRHPRPSPSLLSSLGAGVSAEAHQRAAFCGADYATAARHPSKSIAAALFMFFATLFSTVALGHLIEKRSDHRIGLSEYLAMNSLAGIVHALVGAQPLLVLRPTGPITAITGKLADVADRFGYDFHQFAAATGLCVGTLMVVIALTQASRHIKRLTPFTHDVFACFVCSIYLHDGISDVLTKLDASTPALFGETLFGLNLATLTFLGSIILSTSPSWPILPRGLKTLLADYAVTLAVVLTTAVSFGSATIAATVGRIALPDEFGPTCHRLPPDVPAGTHFELPASGCVREHESAMPPGMVAVRRAWFVGLPTDPMVWLLALNASIPITFFFFMDQNISSLLCQLPEMRLSRGSYLHASFLLMGLFNAIGPLFGLPFVTGSLPHSPQFVRALAFASPPPLGSSTPAVAESRVAPLLMYALIGLPLLAPAALELIPEAAIDGILAYVGYEGIVSTDLWSRVVLLFTPRNAFPSRYSHLPTHRIHLFTLIQLGMFALCWLVNLSPLGLCVAFVVVSLVPLRERALPVLFSTDELAVLDEGRIAVPEPPSNDPAHSLAGLTRETYIVDAEERPGHLFPFAYPKQGSSGGLTYAPIRRDTSLGEVRVVDDTPPLAPISEVGEEDFSCKRTSPS